MKYTPLFFLITLLSLSLDASAASRVIRDNRLDNLGISPALGRGYSVSTNTYQSLCMDKIVPTTPSYDMKYRFMEIEKDWESNFDVDVNAGASMRFLFLKNNANVHSQTSGSTTYHYHYIYADIRVDSYYNSINEGKSTLSDSSQNLLENGDAVSFFESCGPYYVRSIGRHSRFMALLRYRTKTVTRDQEFEANLKSKLKAFFVDASASASVDSSFSMQASEKRLNIVTWAFGLGKDHLGDLIPTDIKGFKETIQNSIKAMQDPDAGRVTSIEVVPWVENTEFQEALTFQDDSDRIAFDEKRKLEANAELVAEISRVDRAQMDTYYQALNCRRVLEEEYLELTGDYTYDPENTWFVDNAAPGSDSRMVTLKHMDSVLSDSKLQELLDENKEFLYGDDSGDDDTNGAVGCTNELMDQGMKDVHFTEVPACVEARKWSVPDSPFLNHYCMPRLGKITTPDDK